jgi:hypothetical protein
MAQQFDFHPYYVLDALSSRFFAVPRYQRSYAWDEKQLDDFWIDMQRSIADGGDYFLGSFVLSNEDKADYVSIIDGQQRIATTTILLSAMRDIYHREGKSKIAAVLDEKYLQEHDVIKDEIRRRVRLNTDDDDFYCEAILKGAAVAPSKESHRRLLGAKVYFDQRLDILVSNDPNWPERLASISNYLKAQARVVVVTTATDADAFTIFETLNDRGADLTIADLLKNYLFSASKAEIESVQKYWAEAVSTLEGASGKVELVSFLRQLWSSYYGTTRERDLYREIKKRVRTVAEATQFAKQIRDGAYVYRAALSADAEYWSGFDKRTRDNMAFVISQSVNQANPLLLSVLSTLQKDEVSSVIKNLVSWIVRIVVAGTSGGGQAERYFCEAAVKVRKLEAQNAGEILKVLQSVVPNDTSFHTAFSVVPIRKAAQARYYLYAIEKFLRNEGDPELVPNEIATQVNLEHILPQNPKEGEWTNFGKDEASAYTHRLGNMTLLRKSENQKLGNLGWEKKREALKASKLKLNELLVHVEDWDAESINVRQEEMSDLAVKVWPLLS